MQFKSLNELRSAITTAPAASDHFADLAASRQNTLTKPQGSLGRLEELAIWLARWQGREKPRLDRIKIIVFAGSHGVTAQGVSAFPAEVTAQMVANFAAGGAAINQLARLANAELEVIPLQIDKPTGDFTRTVAMSESEFLEAVNAGYNSVGPDLDLVSLGEMGIGNTTTAAAIATALFGGDAQNWVGRGTGVDDAGLQRKAAAINAGIARHAGNLDDPLQVAARLGGRELAAMLGAALGARQHSIPLLLDGFVTTAAVAPLFKIARGSLNHAVAGHVSAEAGHRALLQALELSPLLDLGMRLGEGSGAAVAINLLHAAVACHNGMASFEQAGVSQN
ncbi:MAG: nicotinate-nucleotide--dimethylbenzimidazole phosphoribosyltransferase [Rhizobiaceae bacterium]|nr:nicotinate-nucleotide--dimethylbenzimidazole phosphoribosyltransferase [Rhizobiaceae bacterium]